MVTTLDQMFVKGPLYEIAAKASRALAQDREEFQREQLEAKEKVKEQMRISMRQVFDVDVTPTINDNVNGVATAEVVDGILTISLNEGNHLRYFIECRECNFQANWSLQHSSGLVNLGKDLENHEKKHAAFLQAGSVTVSPGPTA